MKQALLFVFAFLIVSAQAQNILSNSGFESYTAGTSSYMTTGNGNATGMPGVWQLAFSGNNFPTCSVNSCGITLIDNTTANAGANSLKLNITKHTNRNDIRLFQSISSIPSGSNFVVKLYVKSDIAGYPFTVNVFKSTEAINSNGTCTVASPCSSFTTTTGWKQYKMYVDLSSWTTTERNNMRISIRPNTTTATPTGPYPKVFWFDDITFQLVNPFSEMKDVAIDVATQRMQLALDSGFTAEANAIAADIITLNNTTVDSPFVPAKAVGFNPVPTHTTSASNPYIAAIHSWAASYLAQSFTGFTKASATNKLFPKTYDARTLTTTAENLHWLLVSPLSNYRYNVELLRRFLTIVYATSDDYIFNGQEPSGVPGTTNNALNDWFTASKACYSWQMAETSFSTYIPNTLKLKLRAAADSMGTQFHSYIASIYAPNVPINTTVHYANRDVNYAETLIKTGIYRNNTAWLNMGKRIVDSINLTMVYPDGAYSYIERQNEVANYHGGNNNSLAKIWSVSEYQPAWDCIKKTPNFELISIEPRELSEFYTVPAWKTMWNGSSGISAEPLLAITQNPYLKTKYDQFRVVAPYDDEMVLSLAYYKANIPALPLPDNYLVYDRNIQGPRGRYGRFSYAATGRAVAVPGSNDCGLQTVIGSMETKEGRVANQDEMDAALMAVHSKVHVRKTTAQTEWTDWAYMMSRTNGKSCVGYTASTISTAGVLQYQTSGPNAFETNWSSYQQWITLPDRVIGIVETYPTNNVTTQAYEIDGRVRFTYGRAALLNPKYIVTEVAGSKYSYGKYNAIIHNHDFTTVSVDTAGVVRDDFRNSMEIIFSYNLSNGNTLYNYPGNTKKYFIVEIRDSAATDNATVSRYVNGNVKGLIVKLNGKSYASYRNDGSAAAVDLSTVLVAGNTNQVLFSRGDSITKQPVAITSTSYNIPANEQVLIISTNTPNTDLGRGWMNYNELLSTNSNAVLPLTLNAFNGFAENCGVKLTWQTANEINVNQYIVEKSLDGTNFSAIGAVSAKCNLATGTNCDYQFAQALQASAAYFRLKMVDADGKYSYSKVIRLVNNCATSSSLRISVSPNPVRKAFILNLSEALSDDADLEIVTVSGKVMHQQKIARNSSTANILLPSYMPSGQYIIKVRTSIAVSQAKIVVL